MMKKSAIWILSCLFLALVSCSTKEKDAPIVIEKAPIIILSETSTVQLVEGQSKKVTVSGQYIEKVEVTSSDTGIATASVKDKIFTINAIAAGTATITITSGKATKALGVEVSSKNVLVERITFGEQLKFPIGKGHQLEFSIFPENATNKKLEWKSDNQSVARVNQEGMVHISRVPNGKATITATATDGSGVSAEITIWAVNPVKEIQINLGDSFTTAIGYSGKLTAEVTGSDAQFGASDPTLSWRSSNPDIIKVSADGSIEALKEGQAEVTATANDGFGAESSITIKAFNPVNKIKVNNLSNGEALSVKRGTTLPLTVTTFYNDKLVETINKGKSQSPYVNIAFSLRDENPNYLAKINKDGTLQADLKGTFTLRVSYNNSLEGSEYIDCAIKVTITD